MHTLHGERACTTNSSYLPENLGDITSTIVAQMLAEEKLVTRYTRNPDIHMSQISIYLFQHKKNPTYIL